MKRLIQEAKKLNWSLEVRCENEKCIELRTLNNEIKQFEQSDITSYKIKAIIDNKTIHLKVEDISDTESVIEEIKKCFEILDNEDKDFLASCNIKGKLSDRKIVDIIDVRNDLLGLNSFREKYPNILNIDSILQLYTNNITVLNTEEKELEDMVYSNHLFMSVSVKDENNVSEASDYCLFKEYKKENLINIFETLYDDANKRLNEESIKSKRCNVIINNNCMFDLLNTFKDAFLAKNINKGVSILTNKFNTQVFSPIVNIVEDPLNEDLPGKRLFDTEGSRRVYKEIICDGKFVTKLYDNRESLKDGVPSTGNSDGVYNMYLVPSKNSFDELIREMNDGIIITDLMGLHSGVNTITGDMSLDAKGYRVENGCITTPLNAILLSANIFEVLNNVKMIGNDLKFCSTRVGCPSILCENIMIVGEK